MRGRSEREGWVRSSRAVEGEEETTAGVEPIEKAIREVAEWRRERWARERWGRPRVRVRREPRMGSPRGPGMEMGPRRERPLDHAGPPGEKAQARRMVEKKAMKSDKRRSALPENPASEDMKAGRAKSHQVESVQELRPEVAAMFSGGAGLERGRERWRGRENSAGK